MAETLLTIHEAAAHVGKSVQTIRRALKTKKLIAKRRKTPQGFNYLIEEQSLLSLYGSARSHVSGISDNSLKDAEQVMIPSAQFVTKNELDDQRKILDTLLNENKKDKETFMRFVQVFQDRFSALENQVRLLEEPAKSKKWYHFWK